MTRVGAQRKKNCLSILCNYIEVSNAPNKPTPLHLMPNLKSFVAVRPLPQMPS
jgi:hypothetical protein